MIQKVTIRLEPQECGEIREGDAHEVLKSQKHYRDVKSREVKKVRKENRKITVWKTHKSDKDR